MNYFEEKLTFIENKTQVLKRGLFDNNTAQTLGIALRIGNSPIVKNLKHLFEFSEKALPADLQVLFQTKDIYLIVHMVGAIRVNGNARIDELQYNAEIIGLKDAQTIDLLPNTSFKDALSINTSLEGALSGGGNFSATLPSSLTETLLNNDITLGGDMKIQLSSNTNFIGKFTYNLKFPVVQSTGIASNFCSWILNPNSSPLLGDQLLIQTVAVPKGTSKIMYQAKGLCKADKGIFWKTRDIETKVFDIEVTLQ
ncbi:MAG: hypothetical protein ACO1PI_10310 [Bacteroidota bacterium]